MDWYVVIGVAVFVFVGGLVAARMWWRLASRGSPYEDEASRGRGTRREEDEHAEVVAWPPTAASEPSPRSEAPD